MPPELAEWLTRLGFGGVFAYMWWQEKARADKEREKNERLAELGFTAMAEVKATLQVLKDIVTAPRAGQ